MELEREGVKPSFLLPIEGIRITVPPLFEK
jgi:hypothetical protein